MSHYADLEGGALAPRVEEDMLDAPHLWLFGGLEARAASGLLIVGPMCSFEHCEWARRQVLLSWALSELDPAQPLIPVRHYPIFNTISQCDSMFLVLASTHGANFLAGPAGGLTRVSDLRAAALAPSQIASIWSLTVWFAILSVDAGLGNMVVTERGDVVPFDMGGERREPSHTAGLCEFLWPSPPPRMLRELLLRTGAEVPPPSWRQLEYRITAGLAREWSNRFGPITGVEETLESVLAFLRRRLERFAALHAAHFHT